MSFLRLSCPNMIDRPLIHREQMIIAPVSDGWVLQWLCPCEHIHLDPLTNLVSDLLAMLGFDFFEAWKPVDG